MSNFVDYVKIHCQSGHGGAGSAHLRREKYIAKGGPDGGDGGRGGHVIMKGNAQEWTLLPLRYTRHIKAENGQPGGKNQLTGRFGEDVYIEVPVGTVARNENGEILGEILEHGQEIILMKGGKGGLGNEYFKSATNQTPRYAQPGLPGEEGYIIFELKVLADVGLVGFPNAGKSTFLSVVSNARPEIANYEFTTLTPNLGVADVDDGSILIADIPGLIEGASEGKGLGDQFLRHVERTAVLLHMIDAYSDDPAEKYQTIRRELEKYSEELAARPEIIALTKCEGLDDEIIAMQSTALQNVANGSPVVAISSQTHAGVTELLRLLRREVTDYRAREAEMVEDEGNDLPVIALDAQAASDVWAVERVTSDESELADEEDVVDFIIRGAKIEKFARRTNFDQFESVNRLRDIMRKMGITHELIRQGAVGESLVQIGESTPFTLVEQ
mgnify:CR=1 FL=1